MRLIDVDALIKDCKEYRKHLVPERDDREYSRISWLIGILEQQQTIEPQKWIPCSERLPEVSYDALGNWSSPTVLLWNDEWGEEIGHFNPIGVFETSGSDWGMFLGRPCKEILAWQPLPEPYGGDT